MTRAREQRPKVNSLREAVRMLAPRWPAIVVATLAITLFAGANLARPLVIQRAIDNGLIEGDGRTLVVMSIIFFFLATAVFIFQAVSTYVVTWVGQHFLRDLRMRLFSHLQRLSMSFFDRESSGRLVARMTSDMAALTGLYRALSFLGLGATLVAIGYLYQRFVFPQQPPAAAATIEDDDAAT